MSVYIPGMEMPKSCSECPLETDYGTCGFYSFFVEAGHDSMPYSRRDDCPLVPVPPHGRLIDGDVMCNECRRTAEEYDGIYPDCTYCPAHLAPTIIPAEEGE